MVLFRRVRSKYSKVPKLKLTSPFMVRFIIVLTALFLLSLFVDNMAIPIFLIVAIGFNTWLADFQGKAGMPTDFELSTFTTVLVTVSTNSLKWGIIVAIGSKLFASIFTGNLLADHFFMMLTYINAAIWTRIFGHMAGVNILVLGLIIVIINSVLLYLISKNVLGLDIAANMSYTGTNLVFNLLVFSIFTIPIYNILN